MQARAPPGASCGANAAAAAAATTRRHPARAPCGTLSADARAAAANMVYPGGPSGFDISPLRPTVPEDLAEVSDAEAMPEDYGGLKLKCEAALAAAWERCDFPYTTLRPPSVIGPACDNRHERLQRIAMGLEPLPPRGGRQFAAERGSFRVAYSEDMGSAVVATLATGAPSFDQAL